MGPLNSELFCYKLAGLLKVDVAVVDANDLGGVKIIACSNSSVKEVLKKSLKNNPAGNDDQKTPIVLIRNEEKD